MKQIFLALSLIISSVAVHAATSVVCQKDNGKIIFDAVFKDTTTEAGSYEAVALMNDSEFGNLDVKGQASLAYTKTEAEGGGLYISEFVIRDSNGENVFLAAIDEENGAQFLDTKKNKKFSGRCLARKVRPAISGSN